MGGYELLGEAPVIGLVHVEAFVALGEEGDKGYAGDGAGLEDDSGPGDFEAGVLGGAGAFFGRG